MLNKYDYCYLRSAPELVVCQLKCMLLLPLPRASQLFAGSKKFYDYALEAISLAPLSTTTNHGAYLMHFICFQF